MPGVRTYDSSQVVLTVGGAVISGFAEGTFITVERDDQNFTKVIGADGTASRRKTTNRSGSLTLTLSQTSPSNDVLSALMVKDEDGSGVVPVLLKDNSGSTRIFSSAAWIQGMPTIEFSGELTNREWVIEMAYIEAELAGNAALGE